MQVAFLRAPLSGLYLPSSDRAFPFSGRVMRSSLPTGSGCSRTGPPDSNRFAIGRRTPSVSATRSDRPRGGAGGRARHLDQPRTRTSGSIRDCCRCGGGRRERLADGAGNRPASSRTSKGRVPLTIRWLPRSSGSHRMAREEELVGVDVPLHRLQPPKGLRREKRARLDAVIGEVEVRAAGRRGREDLADALQVPRGSRRPSRASSASRARSARTRRRVRRRRLGPVLPARARRPGDGARSTAAPSGRPAPTTSTSPSTTDPGSELSIPPP